MVGATVNTRRIDIILRSSVKMGKIERHWVEDWSNSDITAGPIQGVHHGTIMSDPTPALKKLVRSALGVETEAENDDWLERAGRHSAAV